MPKTIKCVRGSEGFDSLVRACETLWRGRDDLQDMIDRHEREIKSLVAGTNESIAENLTAFMPEKTMDDLVKLLEENRINIEYRFMDHDVMFFIDMSEDGASVKDGAFGISKKHFH